MDNYETGIYTDNPDDTLRYMQTTQPVDLWGYPKQETDLVEVVRCKDCVHWEEQSRKKYYDNQYDESICDHLSDSFGTWDVFTAEDFFCKDGERRSE